MVDSENGVTLQYIWYIALFGAIYSDTGVTPIYFVGIGNFRVSFRLRFKARPSAKPFVWKLVLFTRKFLVLLHVNKTDFHMKGFALGLALKQRRKATRKSPIDLPCTSRKILDREGIGAYVLPCSHVTLHSERLTQRNNLHRWRLGTMTQTLLISW